ncbi:hypothetical protein SAMN04489752_3051 [Brevibacterium siliguriense]|uniref:Uncharacterized protein n=1 Tax=Brevibacterium siliguriense TaxID=1136497 RepID=A0A1H1WPT4_9MICO|nr:hypothetical protein [Brevibacterium siliguriense]SDS99084.1 hypothetical protein SAMN04489752_3051 [Brevibacterium siliguriense]
MTETTSYARAQQQLRDRIRDAWAQQPLYIDEIVRPGLTQNQLKAIRHASRQTEDTGLTHFLAIIPGLQTMGYGDWAKFTSDFAFDMHEESGAKQTLVLFSEGETSARSFAYLVTDNGPVVPPGAPELMKSKSDDFIPVELAVPYYLQVLVAAAEGTEPPPAPDFDTRDVGTRSEDYIERFGLDNSDPDTLVFGATTAAALGATLWLLSRRNRYSWRKELTTKPELVKSHNLKKAVTEAATPIPEPVRPDDETWALYDRGRRVQDALTALTSTHPDWAESVDFAHRNGVLVLVTLDRWVRRQLRRRSGTVDDEPRFCFLFPHHRRDIDDHVLKQSGRSLTVGLCADCREELGTGHDPERLMVPKLPGSRRAVPYFQRDDAYALSGFGSFQSLDEAVLDEMSPEPSAAGRSR